LYERKKESICECERHREEMRVKERGCVCAREREEKRKRGAKECVRERETE
jgi:hypothetical protein